MSSEVFVGREPELATLLDAPRNPPTLLLVEGEAGIGKSRLVREALSLSGFERRTVLVAACPPLSDPFPFGPLVEGLRSLRPRVDALSLSALGGALRPLFPEWADDLPPALEPPADAKAMRHRVLRALHELVERLEVELLVLEDAHWADAATLEFVLSLAHAPTQERRLLVTYRPDEVTRTPLLMRLISHRPGGVGLMRVHVPPLTPEETRRLVAAILPGAPVSVDFAAFLHQHTGGVPLAVEESVRLLRDRRDVVQRGGVWARRAIEQLDVPPTVRDSVLERVARLPASARRLLEAAAVVIQPADERVLTGVAGVNAVSGRRGLAHALASNLLTEVGPGRYAYRHVLAAKAVEDAIPASERRRLHRRAAEQAEADEHASVVQLSRHYREAGDPEAWTKYARASAELALQAGDTHTAVGVLLELLTEIEHPPERAAALARDLADATVRRALCRSAAWSRASATRFGAR